MLRKVKQIAAVFAAVLIAFLSATPVSAGIRHMILHQPTTSEPYVAVSNAYHASYQWYVADLDEGEEFTGETDATPVDGQTARVLTTTPDGKKYVCKITWSDGTQIFSDMITNSYTVNHLPSSAEPYVTLNNSAGATYQWHRSNFNSVTVAETDGVNSLAVSTVYEGVYADGLWHGTIDSPVDIEFELKENQFLVVTPSDGFDGTVEEYGESFLHSHSGVYTYIATESTEFNLCIESSEDFSAKVEVITFANSAPVSGQTDNTLTLNADGAYYFCEISGNGNIKLKTPPFKYDLAVTHQPDAKEPFIEINTAQNAAFKWFETAEAAYKVTDNPTDKNELKIHNLWVGSYKSGKWNSNASGTFEGQVLLRKGQTISLILPENFAGGVGGLQLKDGAYTYTAQTNEKFYIYLKNPTPFAFEIYISELTNVKEITAHTQNKFALPVDGKTYRCAVSVDGVELLSEPFVNSYTVTNQPTSDNPCVETNDKNAPTYQWYKLEKTLFNVVGSAMADGEITPYHIYKGTCDGEVWESQNGKLDIEINLKKNDVILVDMSDSHNSSVTVNEAETSFSGEVFTFITPRNGLFNLIVASANSFSKFTASIKIMRGIKGSLMNGTSSALNTISNGDYLCAVTFSDGTTAESDCVTITNGTLDTLEKELKNIAEAVTEDDTEKIIQIANSADSLVPADAHEAARINAISDTASDLLRIITQKSNAVTSLSAAVEEYDINKLIPTDKNGLVAIKNEISALLSDGNLSQNQINTLTSLLDACDKLIDKTDSLNITVSIVNNPQKTEIKFGQTLTLRATVTDMPDGAKTAWYVDGELTAEGETFDFSPDSSSVVTVKILDESGDVILNKNLEEISDSEQVTVKSNFFIKLINFFKKLFGISQTIVQTVR